MKKLIFPIAIPVILVVVLKFFLVPDIELVGVGIMAAAGFFVGVIINMKIWPAPKNDNAEKQTSDK